MSEVYLPPNNKVVAIGGGHGLPQVLKAFSYLGSNLSAIVTTTDNGGSSGRLRKVNKSIAWGDIRNCISSLSDDKQAAELLDFRFKGNFELGGHSLGNIIFSSLEQIGHDPLPAIQLLSGLLKVEANVFPMSETASDLKAVLQDGSIILGETQLDSLKIMPKSISLYPEIVALKEALDAILCADIIILGPGSFFTSLIPPLLNHGYASSIAQSSAQLYFVDNLNSEYSVAQLFSFSDKVKYLEKLIGRRLDLIITTESKHVVNSRVILANEIRTSSNHHCSSNLNSVISHSFLNNSIMASAV